MDLSNLDVSKLENIRVLDAGGVYRDDYKLISKIPNKLGLMEVFNISSNSIVRVHPKRIEKCDNSVIPKIIANKSITVKKENIVNLDNLTKSGELWIKNNIKFDEQTQITAVVFRIDNRYITFNLYNNLYGRKGNIPPIDALIRGDKIGYEINDIDKWQKKLIKNGYRQQQR